MWVTFTWRGKYMSLQMFFPTLKVPKKEEITDALQGVYPGAVCKYYYVTDRDPTKVLLKLPEEFLFIEKDLNAAERRALPDKDFALPGKGKGPQGKQAGSYPIPDKSHARMALAMVAKHGTPEKKAKVRAAVAKKFPDIQQEAIETQAKDRKKLSQPRSVSGSRRDHSHDVDSALTDHVPRKGKGRIRPASKKEMRVSAMRDAGIKQEEADLQKRIDRTNTDIASGTGSKDKATAKEKQLARIKRQVLIAKMRGLRKDPGAADSFTT